MTVTGYFKYHGLLFDTHVTDSINLGYFLFFLFFFFLKKCGLRNVARFGGTQGIEAIESHLRKLSEILS